MRRTLLGIGAVVGMCLVAINSGTPNDRGKANVPKTPDAVAVNHVIQNTAAPNIANAVINTNAGHVAAVATDTGTRVAANATNPSPHAAANAKNANAGTVNRAAETWTAVAVVPNEKTGRYLVS